MVALVGITWVLLAIMPVFLQIFGYNYLPSTNWMNTTKSYRLTLGLILAVTILIFTIKKMDTNDGELRKIGAILIAPFFGFLLGSTPIAVGIPMIASMVAGHPVELLYEVVRADGDSQKGCLTPIELQGLPFIFDSLCGVPNDVRRNYNPRMRILVEGRGTSMGVHPTSFRPFKS